MGASKILSLQNGGASFIKRLFAAPLHFVGRYILPGCLISIFFWVWILLECLDPEPQKRHHFVGTCCSAISLRFSQLSLRNPSFLYGSGCNDMCGVFFLQCWQKVKRSYPFFCPRLLIALLFRILALLVCLDPVAQKRQNLVGACCSAIPLRFPHSALNCL